MKKSNFNNNSGYPDPTAYFGLETAIKEESELDKKAFNLIKVLKNIIALAGFELICRIELRDKKTGKEFK